LWREARLKDTDGNQLIRLHAEKIDRIPLGKYKITSDITVVIA